MKFTLEQFVAAEPAAVWPFLTVPDLMNRWSTATVRQLASGDGDEPWAMGTVRRITVKNFGRKVAAFDEVVQLSKPPHRFVYRVFAGIPARYHRGEITLTPQNGGTLVRWEVAFRFPVPGMAQAAAAMLWPELRKSLRKLAAEANGAKAWSYRQDAYRSDPSILPGLYAAAQAIYDEQKALADELGAKDDPKKWFARVYQLVTELQIEACREGVFEHPDWVLRMVPRFHHYYIKNLAAWNERPVDTEHHWASSFRAAEMARRWKGEGVGELGYSIAKGMQAHIEEDLPRTLAEVYHWYYKDKFRYGRLRADYLLMGPIFRDAASRLIDMVPKQEIPLFNRIWERFVIPEIKEHLMARYYYDISRERRKAFERGERLARLMAGDRPPEQLHR